MLERMFRDRKRWRARAKPVMLVLLVLLCAGCSAASDDLSAGDPAPPFTLPTAQGGEVALADYRGESPVLLYFHMAVG